MSKKEQIEQRVLEVADYVINHNATVRATAKHFGVSKSTVHTDVTLKNGKEKKCRGRSPRRPDSRKYWN